MTRNGYTLGPPHPAPPNEIVRYYGLNHTVSRPIASIDLTNDVTTLSTTTIVTGCGHVIAASRRKPRQGVPTCVRCLAKAPL